MVTSTHLASTLDLKYYLPLCLNLLSLTIIWAMFFTLFVLTDIFQYYWKCNCTALALFHKVVKFTFSVHFFSDPHCEEWSLQWTHWAIGWSLQWAYWAIEESIKWTRWAIEESLQWTCWAIEESLQWTRWAIKGPVQWTWWAIEDMLGNAPKGPGPSFLWTLKCAYKQFDSFSSVICYSLNDMFQS